MHLLPLPVLAAPLGGLVVEVAHPPVLAVDAARRGCGSRRNIGVIFGGLGGHGGHFGGRGGSCSLGREPLPLGRLFRDLLCHPNEKDSCEWQPVVPSVALKEVMFAIHAVCFIRDRL